MVSAVAISRTTKWTNPNGTRYSLRFMLRLCMMTRFFASLSFRSEQRQEQTLIFRFIDYENFFVVSATVYIDIMKQTRCSIARSRTSTHKNWLLLKMNAAVFVFSFCYAHFFCFVVYSSCIYFVAVNEPFATAIWLCKSDETLQWTAHSLTQVKYVVATVCVFSCNLKAKQLG